MVNKIFDAITIQLYETFGEDYTYYVEDVKQELSKPCFTVDTLIPLQRSRSAILYDRTMPMVIHYFSGDTVNTKKDCFAVAERLVECLEYLPVMGAFIRGDDISWQLVDDVLQVFVTYRFRTIDDRNKEDAMDEMENTVSNIY